jgi:FkbM family methyltransferase
MANRVQRSLQERARHYSRSQKRKELLDEFNLPELKNVSLEMLQSMASLRAHLGRSFDVLVDVGAHKGEFAVAAALIVGCKTLVCFEPIPHLLPMLSKKVDSFDAEVKGVALSNKKSEMTLYVHQDESMTSLMPSEADILRSHFATYDGSDIAAISCPVSTLDQELREYIAEGRRFFLKLDTQGNELDVLSGGISALASCDGVLVEYMFTTPYNGQASFDDLYSFLTREGFAMSAVIDIKRRATHRISGVDFLFLRVPV